jgi:DNA-binding transcriptional LysR family regulator
MMEWSRLNTITIHQLRVFCAVCKLLSYTRAAEEVGRQQPTVSALIAELERTTQLTLLEQWGKRLILTNEGREFYAHAQSVITAVDEAWQAMEELRGIAPGHVAPLHIAADTTVGTYVLPHLLGTFHQSHPAVALHLRVANRADVRAALLADEVDLVVAGRPADSDELVSVPFLANPLVVVASPKHPLAKHSHVPLKRLAEETFLLRELGSGTRAAVEELFETVEVPIKIGMVLGHIEAIKQAVAAGLGVSVLSSMAIRREVRCGTLAILDIQQFPIQRHWYIAHLAHKPLSAIAEEFIEFLQANKQREESDNPIQIHHEGL